MRIAFLCKRRYMSKDVIVDRYARLYEIPYQLARLGHEVHGYCLGYGHAEEGCWDHAAAPGHLRWESRSLGRWKLPTLAGYAPHVQRKLHEFRPDVIIGASDIPHVALGAHLAKVLHAPFAADLYDNFEGFGQARIPGFVPALRRAVRGADLVTTTSQLLADYVRNTYHARGTVIAMPSTVDKAVFHARDKRTCRNALHLPEHARLVGTAGGLLESRGIGTLYDGWRILAARDPDIHLVLAGPTDPRLPPPDDARVHYLGMLTHARTAELFCALDVGVIYLRDTPFGSFCFPQKAYEMMACGLPLVASAVGVMPSLLGASSDRLYRADDANDLARALATCLDGGVATAIAIDDWSQVVARYSARLRDVVAGVARQSL